MDGKTGSVAGASRSLGVRITGFRLEEFSVPMTSPLELSLCRLAERRGVLVRIEGVGEEAVKSSRPSTESSASTGTSRGRVLGNGRGHAAAL